MAPPNTTRRRDDPAEVAKRLLDYDAVVFDCDGVIWKGDALVTPLVPVLLEALSALNKPYLFFTNNSLRSRSDYAAKFARLGLDVAADRIFSSSYAAAAYLSRREREGREDQEKAPPSSSPKQQQQQKPIKKKKAYVVGGSGIVDELRLAGFEPLGGPSDAGKVVDFSLGDAAEVATDPGVGAVVVGVDPRLSYWKIHYAAQCLLSAKARGEDCIFVACNEDSRGHFTRNQEWPGAGASVAAVGAVVGRPPDVVVGKPSTFMAREVIARLAEGCGGGGDGGSRAAAAAAPRVLMVGDRLDTDVAWAHAAADELAAAAAAAAAAGQGGGEAFSPRQLGALLVMSGVATDEDLEAWEGRPPEFVLGDVGELAEALAALPGAGGG